MTYKKKLIEVALPLAVISDASSRDKAIKHGHSDNLHQWWARRPLPSARAVLWASLVDDPSAHPDRFPSEDTQAAERLRLFTILESMVSWDDSDNYEAVDAARAEIRASFPEGLPRILDPFGGGGSIPLEAQRLGLEAYSGDLNPVAVLIQRAMIEIPAIFAGLPPVNAGRSHELGAWTGPQGLAADVQFYGAVLCDHARAQVDDQYRIAGDPTAVPLAWIWARTVPSPDPSWPGRVPLVSSWVLRKKPGKPLIWVDPVVDRDAGTVGYRIREGGTPPDPTINRGQGTCVATGAPIPSDYIRACGQQGGLGRDLIAVVADGARGRSYTSPGVQNDGPLAPAQWAPSGFLPNGGLGFRVQNYGMTEWAELFLPRQLRTLGALSEGLEVIGEQVKADAVRAGMPQDSTRLSLGGRGAAAYSDAVRTYLAFAIDKLADLNNALTGWKKDAECPVHLFGRQAIPMVWDFAEAYPFSGASGSFQSCLGSVAAALNGKALRIRGARVGSTAQRDASARIVELGTCAISTDPPYYDNVGYADLSDFFYVWLRHSLGDVWPDETATLLTPKVDETIADPSRHGSRLKAKAHFEERISEFFEVVAKHQDSRVPATVFYAFKQAEENAGERTSTGWETFLQAIIDAGLAITATWPIRTENKSRLRAMGSNALASSVVLAVRPRSNESPLGTRGEFVSALRRELSAAVKLLQAENIAPVDLAQSAIGPGMEIYSRFHQVVEADGSRMRVRAALGLINEALAEVLSGEESEFDADTRFALTWFEQYGHNPGPFGDADLLARAKDTTVAGVAQADVVVSRDGRVRLVERHQLPGGWDPATDARLTVWETTQHLIRALESSEMEAAAMLARMGGGLGDRARQLAYLLYEICDRKKWADEAGAYNMLVTAWPEISRLAAAGPAAEAAEQLF